MVLRPAHGSVCCGKGKEDVCCVLALCVFLSHVDLLVSGHAAIEMATTVTSVTPSAALVLFPTDPEDLERGNDNGTPAPTSDNDDNSLGYTDFILSSKSLAANVNTLKNRAVHEN
ncbi:putative roundabout-like protein [Cricetulus griseus]|nr:putative roundabout-like protein [Cricetulus griseus]